MYVWSIFVERPEHAMLRIRYIFPARYLLDRLQWWEGPVGTDGGIPQGPDRAAAGELHAWQGSNRAELSRSHSAVLAGW